jgi:hypothetical protein
VGVDQHEVRRHRHAVVGVGVVRHHGRDPGRCELGDRAGALVSDPLRDRDDAHVPPVELQGDPVAEGGPELLAGDAPAREERQQRGMGRAHHAHGGCLAVGGHAGDVVGGAEPGVVARRSAHVDDAGRGLGTAGRLGRVGALPEPERTIVAGALVVEVHAQVVQRTEDLRVALEQADDQQCEQRDRHRLDRHDRGHDTSVSAHASRAGRPDP